MVAGLSFLTTLMAMAGFLAGSAFGLEAAFVTGYMSGAMTPLLVLVLRAANRLGGLN
jgi:hypothetical protein